MLEISLAFIIITIKFIVSVVIIKTLPNTHSKTSVFRYFMLITTKNLLIFAVVIYFIQQSSLDKELFYIALFVAYIFYIPFELNYTRKFFKQDLKR